MWRQGDILIVQVETRRPLGGLMLKPILSSLLCAYILGGLIDGRYLPLDSYEKLEDCKDHRDRALQGGKERNERTMAVCLPDSVDPRKPR